MKNSQNIEKNTQEPDSINEIGTMVRPDNTIDQVRDLLFGGAQRSIESNLNNLRHEFQALVNQSQAEFARELGILQSKVLELEQSVEERRLASLREVGGAISELGAVINRLGSDRTGK